MNTNIKGHDVKEVLTSQSSKMLARGISDSGQLEADIDRLTREREGLACEKRELDSRLSELNHEVRGRTLDPGRYRELCREQAAAKKRMMAIQDRLTGLRSELSPLMTVRREMEPTGSGFDKMHRRLSVMADDIREIKMMLAQLVAAKSGSR